MTATQSKRAERVRDWKASGRSASEYARERGFAASTLTWWSSRIRTGAFGDAVARTTSGSSVRMARRKALEEHEIAMCAATTLGRTVRWTEQRAVLDTDLLLGGVLADRGMKYVAFTASDFTTAIERDTLARTVSLQRLFIDVAAWVDADGLHVRWRGGRGGYNWKLQVVVPVYRKRVLTVELQPPVRARVPRPGAWLGELLEEMGFAV